jgi:hypothetical protein
MASHILEAFLNGDFSSLWPPLAAVLTGAYQTVYGKYQGLKDQLDPLKDLQKWAKDYYDDVAPSQLERIRKDVQELSNEVETFLKDVVGDIGNTINQALDQGVIDPQTDGDLGKTRDIYTPDGEVPMDVGTMPGMESDGGGMDRSGGGSSSGGASSGAPSSGAGPSSSGATQPSGSGTQPPSAGDVGAGPGDFGEYQPGQGQVVITHPDGSQTVKAWPPS